MTSRASARPASVSRAATARRLERASGRLATAVTLSACAMLIVGGLVGRFSGRGVVHGALRQLIVGALAAGVTFVIGKVIGDLTGLSSAGLG